MNDKTKQDISAFAEMLKGWPSVIWALLLGTATFTFLMIGYFHSVASSKVEASEKKVFEYLQGRKEVRDVQFGAIKDDLNDLKDQNKEILSEIRKNKS